MCARSPSPVTVRLDKQRALNAGFDEHLVKPGEAEKLEMAIDGSESVMG